MIATLAHKPHELATMFPGMTAEEERELEKDIEKNGQIEPVILLDGKILDGLHREKVCAKLGKTPRCIPFASLPEKVREQGPLAYVIAKNLRRRHLNTKQRSAIAADVAERLKASIGAKNGERSVDGPAKRGRPSTGGKLSEQVAAALNVSPRSVERAKKIKAESPEKFEAMKAGKKPKPTAKNEAAKQHLEAAIARIGNICGKELADGVRNKSRLKNPKDVIAFADQSDEQMKAQAGLIVLGWTLKKAQLYRAKKLTLRHTLEDFANKAASEGMDLSIDIDGWRFTVERTNSALNA